MQEDINQYDNSIWAICIKIEALLLSSGGRPGISWVPLEMDVDSSASKNKLQFKGNLPSLGIFMLKVYAFFRLFHSVCYIHSSREA